MTVREIHGDFDLHHGSAPRTPGLHVSEILRQNALDMGVLKQDDADDIDWTLARYRMDRGEDIVKLYPQAIYRIALGLAWERWLGDQWPQINFHTIGEVTRDGIIGTPDGLSFCPPNELPYYTLTTGGGSQFVRDESTGLLLPYDPSVERPIVHELKATWKSSRSTTETPLERISKEWLWYAQTKSYCWMASNALPEPVTTGHLHVLWVNGNYRGSGPEFRTYELTFSVDELRAHWKLMLLVGGRLENDRQTILG
jgi:hypothetical protein